MKKHHDWQLTPAHYWVKTWYLPGCQREIFWHPFCTLEGSGKTLSIFLMQSLLEALVCDSEASACWDQAGQNEVLELICGQKKWNCKSGCNHLKILNVVLNWCEVSISVWEQNRTTLLCEFCVVCLGSASGDWFSKTSLSFSLSFIHGVH